MRIQIFVARKMIQNILLIQGNAQCSETIRGVLLASVDQSFQIECVNTLALGLRRLGVADIAAILVDLSLPDITGVEIFDRLFAAMPHIPIIIVASAKDEKIAKLAVQRGARDYFPTHCIEKFFFPKAVATIITHAAALEELFHERDRAQIMLNSIGDAVISTNLAGEVTYLNVVAERLTGWPRAEATGLPLQEVFRIVDTDTRVPISDPIIRATHDNRLVALPHSCILISRDGAETAIEDSCAPIHDKSEQVTGTVMAFHDVSSARAVTLNLAYLAQHDSLTDLPNRVFLNDRLSQAILLAQRHQMALAVLYLDLDRFKHINDSLGHLVGDRLLQSVALRLSKCVRASDTVSRQGGDEFVILLPEIAQGQDAVACAQKVIQAIQMPYVIDEHELFVTASVGIVIYPEDGIDAEVLLQNADSAMYEAKARGRNGYQFYRSDVNSKAIERQLLEAGLRLAIQRNEFELYYQSIVNLASGTIAGAEALIRWRHPTLGLLLPAHFMSTAEESGLIVPIGQWVLREACRQAKLWQNTLAPDLRLAVNISAVELRSKDFLAGVIHILNETGFNPRSLDLELTETFLMQDSKSTASLLQKLKELGVHLALDDFGTGYSSLSYMRRFPIDVLKIDRSFVSNLSTNADDASVVRAIINMGKGLHMRVVAEGVETEQQLLFLEEHDCTEAQGYFLGRALCAVNFDNWLRSATPLIKSPDAITLPLARATGVDSYPVPINERERLEELYRYKILDTPPEEIFDRLTRLAARACESPVALITLVDRDRQWFKSRYGFEATQSARDHGFCAHTILGSEPLIVENAAVDPRFADNIFVRGKPGIRFYAGVPLITSRGFSLGSLCVIDHQPRQLTEDKLSTLQMLANQAVQQIELREVAEILRKRSMLLDKVQQTARIGGWEIDLRTNALTWTYETYRIHGLTPGQYIPTVESAIGLYTPDDVPVIRQALGAAITAAVQFDVELKIIGSSGEQKWVRAIGSREDDAGKPRRVVGVVQDIDEVRRLENEIIHIAQREQTRIGLDLHDELGQELTGIASMMSRLWSSIPDAADDLRVQIKQIEGTLRGAIFTCHSVARGLSPTGRDRRGLIGAVRKLAARIEKMHRITVMLQTQGRAWVLENSVADHLYRIVQDSIANAIKHGPVQQIRISVDWNVDRMLIAVTHDGSESASGGRHEGMGLEIMRYRARLIGATLDMSRTSTGVTRLRCNLPNLNSEQTKANSN